MPPIESRSAPLAVFPSPATRATAAGAVRYPPSLLPHPRLVDPIPGGALLAGNPCYPWRPGIPRGRLGRVARWATRPAVGATWVRPLSPAFPSSRGASRASSDGASASRSWSPWPSPPPWRLGLSRRRGRGGDAPGRRGPRAGYHRPGCAIPWPRSWRASRRRSWSGAAKPKANCPFPNSSSATALSSGRASAWPQTAWWLEANRPWTRAPLPAS